MVELDILNPVAELKTAEKIKTAPKLRNLNGKRVGLFWNQKPGGDLILAQTAEQLKRTYSGLIFQNYLGERSASVTVAQIEAVVKDECDAVIASTADWGACTSWLVHAMTQMEKRGIPSVTWIAERFIKDAKASAKAFGLSAISLASIPVPATNQTQEAICKMVGDAIDQVILGLTRSEQPALSEVKSRPSEIMKYQGKDLLEAEEKMNQAFLKEAWSDGFPLVPPTPETVERMLTGTSLSREEVIGLLEPGFGIASVEKIAINAVMAGCQPEHLPVIITAVKCLGDPTMNTRGGLMSTGPQAPLIVVNGPLARKINLNAKSCALGPGSISFPNVVIGRALRLIIMNIGHCYPGVGDMDTLGSPTKFSMCLAENEDDNPWEPFHVEKGYAKDTSTVTVHFNYGLCDLHDAHSTTPEGLIEMFSDAPTLLGHAHRGDWLWSSSKEHGKSTNTHDLIILCPDHARIFARNNWNKQKIREAIHEHARLPLRSLLRGRNMKNIETAHPEFVSLKDNPDAMVPVLKGPECYDIVVAGADVGRSMFTWGFYEPVTKPVESEK